MQNITFITNVGKNTLEHLKLLLKSLHTNLDNKQHEIIVFIDADNENMLEWLLSVKDNFYDLKIIKNTSEAPVGYAVNKTILTEYAKYDIVSYLQADMVIAPHYDTEILKHVKRGRILSSTRVEPPLHGSSPITITKDFGLYPEEFNIDEWNKFSNSIKRDELINYFFAPLTYYKEDWLSLGGYDTIFRRSREDSDLVQRCLHSNIELVQTFSTNVYHFTCVSSRGKDWFNKENTQAQERVRMQNIADQIELRRFIRKWGNFNHGETKLFKFNIDLSITNYTIETVYNIEPFFNKIWLNSKTAEQDVEKIVQLYEHEYDISNKLYGITDEMWEVHKTNYRLDENIKNKISIGMPSTYNVLVSIDFNKISGQNKFINSLPYLYNILAECTVGEYEVENVLISVRDLQLEPIDIKVINPRVYVDNIISY
jgi:hypothetical protein